MAGAECHADREVVTSPTSSPLKGNNTPSEGAVKDTLGRLKTFRESFQRVKERGPLLPNLPVSPKPNMAVGDSLIKKGASSLRRSLRLSKKDKDRSFKQEVSELTVEENSMAEPQEIEESYTLPEIPHTPLSVMQISKLIEMEVLEEAYLNLLALRSEFQQEQEQCGKEASPLELVKKEKDLSLLYKDLREKVRAIVCDSITLPSRNNGLLRHVAHIIQEEEKRAAEPGAGKWGEVWREAVAEGVRAKLDSIPLDIREPSWLAVHLGLLGKAIVEDLEIVKKDIRWSYPPSFAVFSTYVRSYHTAVSHHLKTLLQQVTELKDFYALLDWIINRYQSERIMGSASLRPEMEAESPSLPLDEASLEQLKGQYCRQVQEVMRSELDRIIGLENEEVWRVRESPVRDEGILDSHIHMDIWKMVESNFKHAMNIDAQLGMKVACSCLEELQMFLKSFETEFRRCCSCAAVPPLLWAEYQITYINSFKALEQHMEGYKDRCPPQVDQFNKEVNWLLVRLGENLEDQYKSYVQPYLRRMLSRKWLTNDDDFKQLYQRTMELSQHCALMTPHSVQQQTLVSNLHHHVLKEYVSQLMKNNYSCKNRKNERAARKIREQCSKLRELFQDMNSPHVWLHPIGDYLSSIIGVRNKNDIKNHLQPLVQQYPDISTKHLAAVLYFRGLVRGRERQLILQRLVELKRNLGNSGDNSRALFSDMQVTVNTDCLAKFPFSCLSLLNPNN